jgi:Fe-S cluster assembly iron-binding protein IscA
MLQITDSAAEQLKKALAETDNEDNMCLRLGETQDGLRLVFDQQRPGDTTVKKEDETLLVMDTATANRFDDRTMDFDDRTEQLVFT